MENRSKPREDDTPGLIRAGQLARLLMLSHERLRQLARAGSIPGASRGKYPLVAAVQGYLKFLTGQRRNDGGAAVALADAKMREVTLRTERTAAALVDTAEAEAALGDMLATLRAETAKAAKAMRRDFRQPVKGALDAAFARAERQVATAFADLRAGRDPIGSE